MSHKLLVSAVLAFSLLLVSCNTDSTNTNNNEQQASEHELDDFDGDGIKDQDDNDIDDDTHINESDAFPKDPEEWLDTDRDGVGNNADTDDDNDGFSDEVDAAPLNNEQGSLPVWNHDNQQIWSQKTLALPLGTVRKFQMGDVDNDTLSDIIVLTNLGLSVLFQKDTGAFEATEIISDIQITDFQAANVDLDAQVEIFYFSNQNTSINRLDFNQERQWTQDVAVSRLDLNTPFTLSDRDSDGLAEKIYRQYDKIYQNHAFSTICDLNYGTTQFVQLTEFSTRTSRLYSVSPDGRIEEGLPNASYQPCTETISTALDNYNHSQLLTADLNSDGRSELISIGGYIQVYTATNNSSFEAEQRFGLGEQVRYAAISNIDSDLYPDIVYSSDLTGNLMILKRDANASMNYQAEAIEENIHSTANILIQDIDLDGRQDVIVASDAQGIQAFRPSEFDVTTFVLSGNSLNYASGANDADGNPLTYRLLSSYDSAFFSLDPETGVLTSVRPFDVNEPKDENSDNRYKLSIGASDGVVEITRTLEVVVIN